MRIFKTRWFRRFARKEKISDLMLFNAVQAAESGLIDADLGGGIIKQRVARSGEGKSGGYRTLIYYNVGQRSVFAFGFAKNAMENISARDLIDLRAAARITLTYSEAEITKLVEAGKLEEVNCDEGI
jgi:hypothetical protein